MDGSPPGSSVYGILQARILQRVAIPFFRGIFLIRGSNPHLPSCRQILYGLSDHGSPTKGNELKFLVWSLFCLHMSPGIQSIGEGNGTPLQCSCLENPMGRGAWQAAVRGIAKSRPWPSDFTFTFHFYALEKEMATLSSVLAWGIPGTGSHRVGHDWSDLAVAYRVYRRNKSYGPRRKAGWWRV